MVTWLCPLFRICLQLFLFKIKNGALGDASFFPWLCREKEGGILRRPLLASEALDHPSALALPRDRRLLAPPRGLSLRAEPRGRVRRGGPGRGASLVPLAALPHLSSSFPCLPGRTRQRVWRPCRTSGLFRVCQGLLGARGCSVPTEKDRKESSLNPPPMPGAGRGGETGALGAQTRLRGGASRSVGPTR